MRGVGLVRVAALALLWGSGFLLIKISLRGLSPTQILFTRLALGAAVLLVLLRVLGHRLPTGGWTWLHLTVAAIVGNVVPYLLFALAERQVDSAVAGMLNATTPLWTVAIAAAATGGTPLRRGQLAGLALGLLGTALILAPWAGSQFMSGGALACLAAAFCYGISYVYIGRYLSGDQVGPIALSAGQLLSATGLALLVLPLFGGLQAPSWRADALLSVAVLGALGTGLAYVINYRLIADDGPVAASIVIYLLPVVAVALGAVVLREALSARALLGVAIVIAGVAVARHPARGGGRVTGDGGGRPVSGSRGRTGGPGSRSHPTGPPPD